MRSAVDRGVLRNPPASGPLPTDLLLRAGHCPSLGALKFPFPLPGCKVTPLSRVLGRRAAKGGAPADPAHTCCALSALRRKCRAPPAEASQSGHTPNLPPPSSTSPWAGLHRSIPGRAARKAGIGKSKQAAQDVNVKEALNLSLVRRQGWHPRVGLP